MSCDFLPPVQWLFLQALHEEHAWHKVGTKGWSKVLKSWEKHGKHVECWHAKSVSNRLVDAKMLLRSAIWSSDSCCTTIMIGCLESHLVYHRYRILSHLVISCDIVSHLVKSFCTSMKESNKHKFESNKSTCQHQSSESSSLCMCFTPKAVSNVSKILI